MRSKLYLSLLAICSAAILSSCSGLNSGGGCVTNCGPGTANLTITMYDTPPTGASVLSFTLPIAGISLTPTTGSPVSVPTSVSSVEVTRLQSDSTVIVDAASVAAASYTAINVTIGPTTATNNIFINTSGSTITSGTVSCTNGSVCTLPVGAIFTVTIPLSFTLANNANQWIGLDFNLNNAITAASGISVDFSQTAVLTATTTTRTGIPTGSVDTMEDFIGVVTVYTAGSSITVQNNTTGVSLTAALTSTTEYDLAPVNYSACTGTAVACVTVGSTVSIDTLVSSAGTFTATEVDVLDATGVDEVEGVIYPTSNPNVFGMILADKVSASSDPNLGASTTTIGTSVLLTLNASDYVVDTKTLSSQISLPVIGFSSSSDLLAGQVVRAQISSIAAGTNGITATANNMLLRYSRVSGTIGTISGNVFNIMNLPSYIYAFNPSLNPSTVQVNTFQNLTAFDGVTGTSDTNFQGTAAIRALYLNSISAKYAFQAAKVRVP